MGVFLIAVLFVGMVCAVLGAHIGRRKGVAGLGFLLGLLLGPIGLLIIAVMPPGPPPPAGNSPPPPAGRTSCPSCGAALTLHDAICWRCHNWTPQLPPIDVDLVDGPGRRR